MSQPNGLLSSTAVSATGDQNSAFFISKNNPVIVGTLIADDIVTNEIALDESVLTAVGGALFIDGNPVSGGTLNSLTAVLPLVITGGAVNETISIQNSGVTAGSYTVSAITVNARGLITAASSGTIPPNDDWSDFPAQTDVNMGNSRIVNMQAPINAGDAATKAYADTLDDQNVKLSGNQTIAGIKGFQSGPICGILPDAPNRLANRAYVDSLDATSMKLTGDQTISGIKTFANLRSTTLPLGSEWIANKQYVDNSFNTTVRLTGNQTVAGTKTFSSLPLCTVVPNIPSALVNKAYTDSLVAGQTLAQVLTAGNVANQDINFGGFDVDNVNDIRLTGALPTISAGNILANLAISSALSMTLATVGFLGIASGGILSLGGGTYTTLENLRIDNSIISKETNTDDLEIQNLKSITSSTGEQFMNLNGGQVAIFNQGTNGSIAMIADNVILVSGFTFGNFQTNNQVTASTGNDTVVVKPSAISLVNSTVQHSIIMDLVGNTKIEVNDALLKTLISGNQTVYTDGVTGYNSLMNTVTASITDPMGNARLFSDSLEFRQAGSTAVRSSISPDYLLLRDTTISLGTISTSVTVTNTGGASFNWFTVEMTGSSAVTALNTPLFRNNGVYRIRFNGRSGAVINAALANNAGFTNRTQNTANIGVGANVMALMTIVVVGTTNLISTQVFT